MRDRSTTERLALFGLGGAALAVGAGVSLGVVPAAAALVAVAVAAGLVEAGAVRRTGRHHRILAWLPAVLGMTAVAAVAIVTGPQGPDSGVAVSITVASFAVGIPVFAALVLGVAWAALRVRPPSPR